MKNSREWTKAEKAKKGGNGTHTQKLWVCSFLLWCAIVYLVPKSYQLMILALGLAFHVVIYDKYYIY